MEIPKQLQNSKYRFIKLKEKLKEPIEKQWHNLNNYEYNNSKIKNHVGNLGILGGHGNLAIIDIDDKELKLDIDTFTVKTGSGGKHYYIETSYNKNHRFFNNKGEFRKNNQYVVTPNSTHPNGNKYEIINESEIKKLTEEEVQELIKPLINNKEELEIDNLKTDNSRSGKEFGIVCKLIGEGKSKEEIFDEMVLYSKWSTSPEAYRELTYKKALEKVEYKITDASKAFYNKYITSAEQFYNQQPIYYDKSQQFWIWNFKLKSWVMIDETDLLNLFDETNQKLDTIKKDKNAIIESLKRVGRKHKPKESKKTWVQCRNKIIDIETEEEFESTPEYFLTNPIPWEVGKSEETPILDELFKEWVDEKYITTLYEILAYCMLSDYPIHRLFCLIGKGRNGKGTFMQIISNLIGTNNTAVINFDHLVDGRFESSKMFKKLVCLVSETNFGTLKKTSIIKSLSSQDLVNYEFKNKQPFSDINYATIIIASNELPKTNDNTDGFFSRWLIVDFPNQFTEKEDVMKRINENEYRNLAKKSITILKRLLQNREFTNEGSIEDRRSRYEERSNPLTKFLDEFTVYDGEGFIFRYEFENQFNSWCKEQGYRILTQKEICRQMLDLGYDSAKRFSHRDFESSEPKYYWSYLGITWKKGDNIVFDNI